jgi:hypothetical protein
LRRRAPARSPWYRQPPIWIAGGILVLAIVVVGIVLLTGGDDEKEEPTTAAGPIIASPTQALPPTTGPTPTETSRAIPEVADCSGDCFVRVANVTAEMAATLGQQGLRTAYSRDGLVWAEAESPLIGQMRADGLDVEVVNQAEPTDPLYVVRTPGDVGQDDIEWLGDIVDHAENIYLMRLDDPPPDVDGLAAGISIEQMPPPQAPLPDRSSLPVLSGPGAITEGVSLDNLRETIETLSAIDEGKVGGPTRYYSTRGNAIAADVIARKMMEAGLTVSYQDYVSDDGVYGVNVIGDLPGRDPKTVYLLVGHFDSINKEGGSAPGADDNATGIAAMLEVARILSAYQLKATIRFVALDGEEVLFQGATAFANLTRESGMTYAGAINIDSLGWPGRADGLVINGDADSAWISEAINSINNGFGIGENLEIRQNPVIVADDNTLRDAGIPTVLVARALFGENPVHHTVDDVIENLDLDAVASAATLMLLTYADLVAIYE